MTPVSGPRMDVTTGCSAKGSGGMPPYKDLPDGYIRVMALQLGESGSPLVAELKHYPLRQLLHSRLDQLAKSPILVAQDQRHAQDAHDIAVEPGERLSTDPERSDIDGERFSKSVRELTLSGICLAAEVAKRDDRWARDTTELVSMLPVHKTSFVLAFIVQWPGEDARRYTLDLNKKLGNNNGSFAAGHNNFSATARDISLTGASLTAELRRLDGSWNRDTIDIEHLLFETWRFEYGYEALSYCWGEPQFTQQLFLAQGGTLAITESLYACLQRLRYKDKTRYLWVDAVCINQQDSTERDAQVQMMGEIYKFSRHVLVWLGEAETGDSEALVFAAVEARQESRQVVINEASLNDYIVSENGQVIKRPYHLTKDGVTALIQFLKRPWFSRLWVVQEILLAPRTYIQCGTYTTTELSLFGLLGGLYTQKDLVSHDADDDFRQLMRLLEHARAIFNVWEHPGQTSSGVVGCFPVNGFLWFGIPLLYGRQCREPIDRVLALHALFQLGNVEDLRVDYRIAPGELYRRIAVHCLKTKLDVATAPGLMLALVGTEMNGSTTLPRPSWVPDLHHLSAKAGLKIQAYRRGICGVFLKDVEGFCASVDSSGHDLLRVRGVTFARISSVLNGSSCPLHGDYDEGDLTDTITTEDGQALVKWYLRCRHYLKSTCELVQSKPTSGEARLRMLSSYTTPVGGTGSVWYRPSLDTTLPADEREIATVISSDQGTVSNEHPSLDVFSQWVTEILPEGLDDLPPPNVLRSSLLYWLSGPRKDKGFDPGRHLACTTGRFGRHAASVPPTSRPGDYLCYLTGAPFPFAIRDRGDGTFKVLGDAFVHKVDELEILGINDGQWTHLLDDIATCDTQAQASCTYRLTTRNAFEDRMEEMERVIRQSYEDVDFLLLR